MGLPLTGRARPRGGRKASTPDGGTRRDLGSYRLQEAAAPGVLSAGGERLARAPALALPRLRRGGLWPTGSASMVTRRAGEGGDRTRPRRFRWAENGGSGDRGGEPAV